MTFPPSLLEKLFGPLQGHGWHDLSLSCPRSGRCDPLIFSAMGNAGEEIIVVLNRSRCLLHTKTAHKLPRFSRFNEQIDWEQWQIEPVMTWAV